ncbi:MAG TPA: hypothetical protein VFA65_04285 [Bryobacteraceae bacterium]|nr:hypothetical protein [Bryobacteraceae bacterium]
MSTPVQTPSAPSSTKNTGRFARWHRRVLGFCMIIFALEIGVFLTVFPWLSNWDQSWVPLHSPRFADFWTSPYFRAGLSGLGLLNIYIAASELLSQLKSIFSPH